MIPVGTDALAWMAEEAGLPLFQEERGVLSCNAAAGDLCGHPASLLAALHAVTGVAEGAEDLASLLSELEAAGRASGRIGEYRVVAVREGERTVALCVPSPVEITADLQRRAAMSDLSAGVSHELSNALGAILGWTDLARRQASLRPATERAIRLIEASARSAHATARHMLEAARGTVVGAEELVDLTSLLHDIRDLFQAIVREAGVRLDLVAGDGLTVRGSQAQLFTIFWNLVQNAVEATPPGGAVDVRAVLRDGMVHVEVEDDGPGVAEADRERILQPYFTTKSAGTGLGLALVQRALRSLRGTLEIGHAPGRGARFVARIPFSRAKSARPPAQHRDSGVLERGDPRGARILVVDDDESMRELLTTALELSGAKVQAAARGDEALALEGPFDLALLDLGLEDMRGDALLAELRRTGKVQSAALVSGASMPPERVAGGEPDAWVRKPFELEDMLATVRHLLGGPRRKKAADGPAR